MELFMLSSVLLVVSIIISAIVYQYAVEKKRAYIKSNLLMENDGDDPCNKDHSFTVETDYAERWIIED